MAGSEPVDMIIHLTHPSVMANPDYRNWMESCPPDIKHLIVNEENDGITHKYAWDQQVHLNMIESHMFPILHPLPTAKDQQQAAIEQVNYAVRT